MLRGGQLRLRAGRPGRRGQPFHAQRPVEAAGTAHACASTRRPLQQRSRRWRPADKSRLHRFRQCNREPGAALRAVLDADAAAVQLDQVLDDREPEARCRRDRGRATCRRGRNARTRASDPRPECPALRPTPAIVTRPSSDVTSIRIVELLRRVGDGVGDEVAQRVVQLRRIGADDVGARARSSPRCAAGVPRRPRRGRRRPPVDERRACRTAMTSSVSWPASSRASRSRSLTSRSIRCVWRPMISRNRRSLLGAGVVLGQRFDVAADGRQRRAQLVRHVRDEVAADLIGAPQVGDVVQHEDHAVRGRCRPPARRGP